MRWVARLRRRSRLPALEGGTLAAAGMAAALASDDGIAMSAGAAAHTTQSLD
eukprot:SAG25_NODE_9554_length_368_cov_0.762082_1_plen_51_part_10